MVKEEYKETSVGKIPIDWEIEPLNNVGKITGGSTPRRSNSKYWGGEIPWLTPSQISDKLINNITNTDEYMTQKGLENSSAKLLPIGTVLMSSRATIGECVINNVPMTTNQGFANIICEEDKIYNYFLMYLLRNITPKLEALAGGSTFLEISRTSVRSLNIPLPPLPEQKKIASILSSVDKAIEKTNQVVEKTKELKKGLMQQLLTKGIGYSEFKEVRIGPKNYQIPDKWNIFSLDPENNLTTKVTDGSHYSPNQTENGKYYYATVTNLSENGINYSTCNKINNEAYEKMVKGGCKPQNEDVLFSKDGTVGISAVFNNSEDVVLLSSIAIIRPTKNIISRYLKYYLSSKIIMDQIKSFKSGTAIRRVVLRDIKKFKILVPPLKEQKKIASILSSVDKKIEKEKEYKEKLERLKKGLMQKLLTGEVRVNVKQEV